MTVDARILERLFATVEARRGTDPDTSYTARLLARGPAAIAKKVGEEAVETVLEAVQANPGRLAAESADLLYHLVVLWAACGVRPEAVWAALEAREGRSGIAEKAARPLE